MGVVEGSVWVVVVDVLCVCSMLSGLTVHPVKTNRKVKHVQSNFTVVECFFLKITPPFGECSMMFSLSNLFVPVFPIAQEYEK